MQNTKNPIVEKDINKNFNNAISALLEIQDDYPELFNEYLNRVINAKVKLLNSLIK